MRRVFFILFVLLLLSPALSCRNRGSDHRGLQEGAQGLSPVGQSAAVELQEETRVLTGAERPDTYLPLLEGKNAGLVVNHTAVTGEQHLLDFLLEKGVRVTRVFAPEHGFRGEAAAGEKIANDRDPKTGVEIISLYGDNRKPLPAHLKGLDFLVFDIQDVGCRFYTYLSTLCLVMEACAENGVPLVVLDRPNPNGDYVAGPMLKPAYSSFVGMVPVPVVHGCTMGEMALMINGEKWHKAPGSCDLTVISAENYTHLTPYVPPVPPSPNLPNYQSIRLYPSLCYFEATTVSIGRGTPFPFQVIGGTRPDLGDFTFVPADIPGFVNNPINEGLTCHGVDLRTLTPVPSFTFSFFLDFYRKYPTEKEFLNNPRWFNLLAGDDKVLQGIREGKNDRELTALWQEEIERYKTIRKKYLLYPDFE